MELAEPTRKYYADDERTATVKGNTGQDSRLRVPVENDTLFSVRLQKYLSQYKSWEDRSTLWRENRSRAYNTLSAIAPM